MLYIAREAPQRKAAVVTAVLLDRVMGLVAVVMIATVALLLTLKRSATFRPLLPVVVLLLLLTVLGVVMIMTKEYWRRYRWWAALEGWTPHFVRMMVQALYEYRMHKLTAAVALLESLALQVLMCVVAMYFGQALQLNMAWHQYFVMFPILTLVLTIPITPSGLGVTELFSQEWFGRLGQGEGAGIAFMLLLRLSMVSMALPGLICFLLPGTHIKTRDLAAQAENLEQAVHQPPAQQPLRQDHRRAATPLHKQMSHLLITALRVCRPIGDFVMVYGAFFMAYQLYFFDKPRIWGIYCPELSAALYYVPTRANNYLTLGMGMGVVAVAVYSVLRLYHDDTSILHVKEYRNALAGFAVTVLVFLAGYYLWVAYTGPGLREKLFSRRIFGYACLLGMAGIVCVRGVINNLLYRLHRRGVGARRVAIYGAGQTGRAVARRLSEFPAFGLIAVGFIDDDPALAETSVVFNAAQRQSLWILGTGAQLADCVRTYAIDDVLLAIPSASAEQMFRVVHHCQTHNIQFHFVPNIYQLAFQHTHTHDLVGIPIISVRRVTGRLIYFACKRTLDIVASMLGLIVLAPLFLLIAVLIRWNSRGPALFVQTRVGLNGAPFQMIKFRTMYVQKDRYALKPAHSHDQRITPIGRWLRRTSLDELPQLFNVLRGQMSLVGPRPEMPFVVESYTDLQRERLKVKPGITGLWQLSADRRVPIHENMDYDLYYINEQSFLLDIVILVQTLFFAFRGI
jgi:exopolysaccharide biosynthesis polyprenyl glycosylphosphotransferase